MSSKSFGHTAHYTYIDEALRARWDTLLALEREVAAFVPKPMEEFKPRRDAEVERLQRLNPNTPEAELAAFVDRQIAFLASRDWQFIERFDQRHMTEYVTVVMLSHALSEALINAVLAIGLAHAESVELFPLLEKADFKQKWLFGPKSFSPSYVFPHGGGLHETLTILSRQRNALVHHKIELKVGDKKVLEGSGFERKPHAEEQRWLRRFFSFPYDLAQFVRESIRDVPLMLLFDRKPIEAAPEHGRA
jgi:hypothetical protein